MNLSEKDTQLALEMAEEITSIRNQLWVLTEEIPMTRAQAQDIEIIKQRLWRVQERLRGIE